MRIRLRHRSLPPTPWKWEIVAGQKIVTASHESFISQGAAHYAGRKALKKLILQEKQKTAE